MHAPVPSVEHKYGGERGMRFEVLLIEKKREVGGIMANKEMKRRTA